MNSKIIELDQAYNWHPFTQVKIEPTPLSILKAEGAELTTEDGRTYIDAISSWWVAALGHRHPAVVEAINKQLDRLDHVIFAGCTHQPAAELAEILQSILPGDLKRVFYTDNGSCAVEVALKMCVQFYANRGIKKTKFIALENAYHGDTFGAMSVGARSVFNAPYQDLLFDVHWIQSPNEENLEQVIADLKDLITKDEQIAGFIYEPLVQGAGGMLMYQSQHLDQVLKVFKDANIFCIADEIMTGFYRTGTMFASDQMQSKPDIICLSKALTAGFLPLGLTVATEEIYEAFISDKREKLLSHGHSFSGNPLACAAAVAAVKEYLKPEIQEAVRVLSERQASFVNRLREQPGVVSARSCGIISAFELKTDEVTGYTNSLRNRLYKFYLDSGVLLRPLGNTVYILPPYCITEQQLARVYDVVLESCSIV